MNRKKKIKKLQKMMRNGNLKAENNKLYKRSSYLYGKERDKYDYLPELSYLDRRIKTI